MRITGLLGRTLRAVPAGVSPALGLAARAGFLRRSEDGWLLLPLGVRVVASAISVEVPPQAPDLVATVIQLDGAFAAGER